MCYFVKHCYHNQFYKQKKIYSIQIQHRTYVAGYSYFSKNLPAKSQILVEPYFTTLLYCYGSLLTSSCVLQFVRRARVLGSFLRTQRVGECVQ